MHSISKIENIRFTFMPPVFFIPARHASRILHAATQSPARRPHPLRSGGQSFM